MSNGYFIVYEMKDGRIETMGNHYDQDATPQQFMNDLLDTVDVENIERFIEFVMDKKDGANIQRKISVKEYNARLKGKHFDINKLVDEIIQPLKDALLEFRCIPMMMLVFKPEDGTCFLVPNEILFKSESPELRISILETMIDMAQKIIVKERESIK